MVQPDTPRPRHRNTLDLSRQDKGAWRGQNEPRELLRLLLQGRLLLLVVLPLQLLLLLGSGGLVQLVLLLAVLLLPLLWGPVQLLLLLLLGLLQGCCKVVWWCSLLLRLAVSEGVGRWHPSDIPTLVPRCQQIFSLLYDGLVG